MSSSITMGATNGKHTNDINLRCAQFELHSIIYVPVLGLLLVGTTFRNHLAIGELSVHDKVGRITVAVSEDVFLVLGKYLLEFFGIVRPRDDLAAPRVVTELLVNDHQFLEPLVQLSGSRHGLSHATLGRTVPPRFDLSGSMPVWSRESHENSTIV